MQHSNLCDQNWYKSLKQKDCANITLRISFDASLFADQINIHWSYNEVQRSQKCKIAKWCEWSNTPKLPNHWLINWDHFPLSLKFYLSLFLLGKTWWSDIHSQICSKTYFRLLIFVLCWKHKMTFSQDRNAFNQSLIILL